MNGQIGIYSYFCMSISDSTLKGVMRGFCSSILDKIVNESYESVSCSGWDTKRSAYTQIAQLYLVDEKQSDEEIIMKIFPFTAPCYSGTCEPSGKPWIPKNHRYIISRHALNGWAPQNHMDCAAAAAAGAINAALGIPRGSPAFVTTHDVVNVMKLRNQCEISNILDGYQRSNPSKDLSVLKTTIFNTLHSDVQPRTNDDNRESVVNYSTFHSSILENCGDCEDITKEIIYELYLLKLMRMVECRAGFYPLDGVINSSGLPVTARLEENYSWEMLKQWVADPNTAVIAYIPRHAVLIFGTGETEDGKYRHVLLGRASGGQTPSSWIPWSQDDVHKDEDLWYPGGKLGAKNLRGLDPLFVAGDCDYIACVVTRNEELVYSASSELTAFTPPPYLLSRELICSTCVLHKGVGDSVNHPLSRKKWLEEQ